MQKWAKPNLLAKWGRLHRPSVSASRLESSLLPILTRLLPRLERNLFVISNFPMGQRYKNSRRQSGACYFFIYARHGGGVAVLHRANLFCFGWAGHLYRSRGPHKAGPDAQGWFVWRFYGRGRWSYQPWSRSSLLCLPGSAASHPRALIAEFWSLRVYDLRQEGHEIT